MDQKVKKYLKPFFNFEAYITASVIGKCNSDQGLKKLKKKDLNSFKPFQTYMVQYIYI